MTGQPLVSCVVPVFNRAAFLADAIASIEAQTWHPIEIIIVNDGSTDDTASVIAAMGERVRALHQENAGPASARNRGTRAAKGDFIAFLDSDDEWLPEKLSVQMARFKARPDLEISLSQAEHWWIPELREEAETLDESFNSSGQTGGMPVAMIRRALFDRIGMLDESLRHLDWTEWVMRAADSGAVIETLPDILTRRRIHHDNMSRNRAGEEPGERLQVARSRLARMRRPSS
jgi:glycosyltransferase involved in cell wall biosynthesis